MASRKPVVVLATQGATVDTFEGADKPTLQGDGIYIRISRRNAAPILLSYAVAHAVVDLYNKKSGYHHPTDCTDDEAQRPSTKGASKEGTLMPQVHPWKTQLDTWEGLDHNSPMANLRFAGHHLPPFDQMPRASGEGEREPWIDLEQAAFSLQRSPCDVCSPGQCIEGANAPSAPGAGVKPRD